VGWVRGLDVHTDGSTENDRLLGHLPAVTQMRIAPDGYIYALTLDGILHRVTLVAD
jgi:hypothetical protein